MVRYEDLKRDKLEQVARMLDFLHQDYNRTELAAKLEAGFDDFHRKHTAMDEYDHYTKEQRAYIKSIVNSTIEKMDGTDNKELRLNEYLYY